MWRFNFRIIMDKKFGALSSSANPQEISATVTGAMIGVTPVIIFIAGLLGLDLATSDVAQFAQLTGLAASGLWMGFGATRKLVLWLNTKWQNRQG